MMATVSVLSGKDQRYKTIMINKNTECIDKYTLEP
jgi:hypothetical protein